jgi:anaerobic magnesium-protoporphyrin IX monomethyl ester cyclase
MKNDLDILLIHPNAASKVYQDLSRDLSAIEPPIWAGMIASYLRRLGWNVAILDCEALGLSIEAIVNEVRILSPRLIASVVYGQQPSSSTHNMYGAMMLMKALSSLDIPKIFVGPHPSALPKQTVLEDITSYVCQGEGPVTLHELLKLRNLKDFNDLTHVPGLWFFNTTSNDVCSTKPAPLLINLDVEMPNVAFDLLPIEKYRTANWHSWPNYNRTQPFAAIYTSLGCPFQCSFCMINAPFNNGDNNNNKFRHWSPEHIIKTLDKLADMGIVNLKIADELFVLKPPHFLNLCKLIYQRGHKFNIWAYSRIDTLKPQYLEWLKKAGVNFLGLGIESGNKTIRKEITKGKFEEVDIKSIITLTEQHGIYPSGNYIFGLPNDTLETMQQTFDLACELNTIYANFYCAMAYPGSQLHRTISQTQPKLLPENNGVGWLGYSQHSFETFPLSTNNLTNAQILKFRDEAVIKYFENPIHLTKLTQHFGSSMEEQMRKMLSVKLKRKLFGDTI